MSTPTTDAERAATVSVSVPQFDQADRLRKALRHAGVSVSEMAEYLGITRETVGRYTNHPARVPLQTLRLWALRTGVPLEWLLTGEVPEDVAVSQPAEVKAGTGARKASSRNRRPLDYKTKSRSQDERPALRQGCRRPASPPEGGGWNHRTGRITR